MDAVEPHEWRILFFMPGGCQNQACFTGIPGMARGEYPGKNSTIWHGFSLLLYHRSQFACSGPVQCYQAKAMLIAQYGNIVFSKIKIRKSVQYISE